MIEKIKPATIKKLLEYLGVFLLGGCPTFIISAFLFSNLQIEMTVHYYEVFTSWGWIVNSIIFHGLSEFYQLLLACGLACAISGAVCLCLSRLNYYLLGD